ncbi:FN3 associated domain-containing protein, partial [Paramuribaculum intestinale]|uniref:FN3 associated domain-containing protein n=1 Tax=Paramuribaculum intestinale TaxID=2094151 RepID=UPI0025B46EF4
MKYYYMLSDAPVDAASFTTAAATEANEVTIDGSKAFLAVRAYATVDGKEVGSAVRNFEFVTTDIINLESAAEITADLKGKTVRLGFPLNIIADGTLGSDKLTYMIYARDPENNPVVMKSRLASTTDATTPGAAFQITKNATPKGVIFAPAAGVIATVDTDKAGHPILVLKDADNSIDHFAECYTGAALAFDATEIKAAGIDLNYALTLNTHNLVEEISESHYGRMVYMRGVTYNTADKRFEKDGKTIPVATDPTNLDKYIQAPSSFYKKFTTLPTDATSPYTICGIVEYDPNAEAGSQYYIMLRNCVETQDLTGITFPTAGQVKGSLTENDDKTAGSIDIIHSATTIAAHPTGATSGGYIYTYTDHSKGTATTSFISYSSNISITNDIIFFKDGKCEIKIARTSLISTTNDIEYDRGDTYTLTLNDEAKGMPVYSAFSQIDPANDKGFVRIKTPYSIPYHVGNASGNWDWPIAMTAYLKGNYILVRDVATNDDGQPAAHQDQNPDFYLVYSEKGWGTNVVRNHYRTSSSTGRRAIIEGDGVAILTFQIGEDDMVLDASNMAIPSSNTNSTNDWHFTSPVGSSESAYKDHLDDWRVSSTISDPKQTLIDESYLRKVIAINGAKIKKTADDNATISLKNDVALSWDCLGAADKDTHQAVIANAGDDATYNVTAYVMKDGNGGFKLEVISLECLTGIISVCEHEHHDTYYGKASLDRFADGGIVTLRGVKVTKTFAEGSTTDYTLSTTIGNEEIDFVWETNASLEYTHKNTINKDMGTNTVTPSTFNISGNLKIDGDKKSIDLATVGKQSQSKLTVYSNGATIPTSKIVSFQSYARITFDAPKGTEIAYKILSVEGEPVDDGKWLPITTSDTLTIDRTHVIQIAGCAAGSNAQTSANISFTKTAKEAKSIDDMLAADNTTNYLHLRNTVRVSSAFTAWPFGNILTVTDGAGHHLLLHVDNYSPLPETGSLLKDFAVQRVTSDHTLTIGSLNNSYQYQFIGNTADYTATPEEGDDLPSIEPLITDSPEAADVEKLIRITDAFITGENASNLTVKTAGGNTIALRNAFECEIADNGPESGYILTGLLLPRKGKSVPRSEAAVVADEATPLTLDDMEFLPINIEKRRAAATPRLEVTGHESMEDNTVVTIEDVTVSMTSDEAYSTIEYSTDGGTTWTVYDGKPLTIGSSTEIQARTIVKGFDPSAIAKLDIRREYYSDAAKVVTEQKGGYTLVTLLPVNDLPQGTGYTIHYTLDGSEPGINSDVYSAPLELTEAATVKALMIEQGKRPAKTVASQALTVRANDLDITADKGEGFTTVAIAPKNAKHVDPKAEIRYTTDGTEPTAQSTLYKGEFEVEAADNGMTIKAICIEPGKTAGNVASATVAVEGLRPSCDVTISYKEAEGVYTITLTAPAGKIFYALNDATEFKLYDPAKPITYVSDTDGTCRIRAYALEEGKKEGK